MKYARKTAAVILVILFVIALAISAAVATMVKNVNVYYSQGTGEGLSAYTETLENLENLKGGNMFLLGDDDVYSCVSDTSRITLVSYKKSYPCTLEVEIAERVETFYSYKNGACSVYDEYGVFMYLSDNIVGGTEEDGFVLGETDDLSPNVIIEDGITQAERTLIAESCVTFKNSFGSLRGIVKSVRREINPDGENLVFTLRSGLEIEISVNGNLTEEKAEEEIEEKIAEAYSCYLTLTDGQKTGGQIRAYTQENSEGKVTSDYIP